MEILRTDSSNSFFLQLVQQLDAELASMYGKEMEFFSPHNILSEHTPSVVIFLENKPAAIGAFRALENEGEIEIKRMFVVPRHRGKGLSKRILSELEKWALEQNFTYAKLETGEKNKAALQLYPKSGYQPIEPFGPYKVRNDSFCFGKKLLSND